MKKVKVIELNSHRGELHAIAKMMFKAITEVPAEVRKDTKPRTGLIIDALQMYSLNIVHLPVMQPSDLAHHFASEKNARSAALGHFSSQNSADPAVAKFAGSLTLVINGIKYQVAISGLQAEEDVAIALCELSYLSGWSVRRVCNQIKRNKGTLPSFVNDQEHYLYGVIGNYWTKPITEEDMA